MKPTHQSSFRGFWQRGGTPLATLALAFAVCASIATPAEGSKPDEVAPLQARSDIEDLSVCYATGTDAIGRGDLAEGKKIYSKCFTEDATFALYFPGTDPSGPPDLNAVGTDAWAQIANDFFRDLGAVSTQHLMSNFVVDVNGNQATLRSYLQATHVIDPAGVIVVAHGTYFDDVVRTPKGWKIAHRTLRLITSLRLESPLSP
jgi:hypothetical protein